MLQRKNITVFYVSCHSKRQADAGILYIEKISFGQILKQGRVAFTLHVGCILVDNRGDKILVTVSIGRTVFIRYRKLGGKSRHVGTFGEHLNLTIEMKGF